MAKFRPGDIVYNPNSDTYFGVVKRGKLIRIAKVKVIESVLNQVISQGLPFEFREEHLWH